MTQYFVISAIGAKHDDVACLTAWGDELHRRFEITNEETLFKQAIEKFELCRNTDKFFFF